MEWSKQDRSRAHEKATMLNNRSGMSYHDDYVRKAGVPLQGGHSPLPLLTDRGAYLNFLEVQLERVSSAVMGIKSYDQYLADVQNLIVSLENRCTSNTNLCAAVQQCMEEIRTGVTKSITEITETYKEDHRRIISMQDSLASKLLLLEERLSANQTENKETFNIHDILIKQNDERLTKITDHIKHDIRNLSENHTKLKERSTRNYEEHNAKLDTTIEVIQTKMGNITEDMDRRVEDLLKKDAENKVKIRGMESSFIQELADARLEAINMTQNTSVRFDNKLHALYTDIGGFKEHVDERADAQRRLMKEHVDSTRNQQELFEREQSKLVEGVHEVLNQTRSSIDELQDSHRGLHDSNRELHDKSQEYHHRLGLLAENVDHSLNQIKHVHDVEQHSQRQLHDLREHLHNMSLAAPFGAGTESPIRTSGDTPIYRRERGHDEGRARGHDEGKEEAAVRSDTKHDR